LFSGLEVLAYNLNRKQKDLKMFEFGKIYRKINNVQSNTVTDKYKEQTKLAIFITGNKFAETWQQPSQKADFYDLAGIVEKVLLALRIKYQKETSQSPNFSFGLSYKYQDYVFAQIGQVQANLLKIADLKSAVWYAELDWDWLVANYRNETTYQEISKFPEVKRDLSLILDKKITYQEIEKKAFELEKKWLKRMNVFSVFEGEQIGEGKKSYAISFFLQDDTQTLTDTQIDKTMQKLMEGFKSAFGAVIRS
jgi:phenylalanyl-tRNA synthetase beta chain